MISIESKGRIEANVKEVKPGSSERTWLRLPVAN